MATATMGGYCALFSLRSWTTALASACVQAVMKNVAPLVCSTRGRIEWLQECAGSPEPSAMLTDFDVRLYSAAIDGADPAEPRRILLFGSEQEGGYVKCDVGLHLHALSLTWNSAS